jgi:hypothetical protein
VSHFNVKEVHILGVFAFCQKSLFENMLKLIGDVFALKLMTDGEIEVYAIQRCTSSLF